MEKSKYSALGGFQVAVDGKRLQPACTEKLPGRCPAAGKDAKRLFFSADRDDTALAVGFFISIADHAAQGLGDIVDQDLVVQLDGFL